MDIQPLLPHYGVIVYLGQDDKASVTIVCSVLLAAVGKQYSRGIVGQDQRVVSADNNWHAEKMVPSVANRMSTTEKSGKSLYSGGPNGLGRILFSVHNATTDPSTGLKHIANAYDVLIEYPS